MKSIGDIIISLDSSPITHDETINSKVENDHLILEEDISLTEPNIIDGSDWDQEYLTDLDGTCACVFQKKHRSQL